MSFDVKTAGVPTLQSVRERVVPEYLPELGSPSTLEDLLLLVTPMHDALQILIRFSRETTHKYPERLIWEAMESLRILPMTHGIGLPEAPVLGDMHADYSQEDATGRAVRPLGYNGSNWIDVGLELNSDTTLIDFLLSAFRVNAELLNGEGTILDAFRDEIIDGADTAFNTLGKVQALLAGKASDAELQGLKTQFENFYGAPSDALNEIAELVARIQAGDDADAAFATQLAGKQPLISAPSDIGAATSAQGAKADSAIQAGDARLIFTDHGFADLAAAVTAAGAANADLVLTQVHTVDADLTISVPLSFRGGAISVDAGVTVTITEQIPMTEFRHIFLGAGTIIMGGTAFRTRPEWWGAQRTGLFDCALAIMNAYNAVKGIHGIVNYVPGAYGIASRLDIGDGVLGTTVSTTAGVTFESWNSGVGGGEYTLPNLITQIKWIGAANDNEFMMRINGPTHSIRMSNLTFNCNALVSGIDMAHCYNGYNHYARVENYTQWGWHIVSDGDAPTGITQGAFDNHFERCVARLPAKATATGWLVHWASRIVLDHCESVYGGAGDSAGFRIGQMDNCTWIQPFSAPAGPISGNACGMRFDVQNAIAPQQGLPPVYMGAWDNTFIMPIALGGVKAFDRFNNEVFALDHDSFYSPNIFVGFPERDGQTAPDIRGINIITHTGRMIGHWTGVLETLSGQTPDLLSTGSAEWFFPTGCGAGVATGGFDRFMIMPSPGKFLMSWAYLGGAPGSGNAREFHIEKNGVETGLVNRFADADVGGKYQLGVVNFNEGDAISFKCDIEGAPAAARAHWFARYQLTGTGVLG